MAALISCRVKQKQSEAIRVLDLNTSVIHTYILHEKTVPFYFITYYFYASPLISVSPSVGFLLNYDSITAFSLISLKPNHSCTNNGHFVIDCINAKS